MRLLIAMMKHETNTFSPVPTPLARFGHAPGPLYGEAAVAAFRGTGSGLGAYLDLAAREKAEMVLPIAASAPPSRPVDDDAFEHIVGHICDAVAKGGFDGIMLDLHGAMVTESLEDGEGELLRRIRAIDATVPIAVAYDMHANLYPAMVENATVVSGYRTYPHIDTYETAQRAGEVLLKTMRGEVRPVIAWGNVPMLPHVMKQGSDDEPNAALQARVAALIGEGALAASLFTGFPHADISNAGLSAVVVTDGDRDLAERMRDELLDRAWVGREDFVYKLEPLAQSLKRAQAVPAARGRADRAPRPLRQLRLGRDDGHDGRLEGDPRCRARQCRRLRDLRPRGGAAGDRGRDRRRGDAVGRRQDGDAANPRPEPAADDQGAGQDDLQRPVPQQGADGARRADGYGAAGSSIPARSRSR